MPSKDIYKLVKDIIMLGIIINVQFVYWRISANVLADKLTRETIHVCISKNYH